MNQVNPKRRSKKSQRSRRMARRSARVALRLTAIVLFIVLGLGAGVAGVWLRQALRSGELFALNKVTVQGLQQLSKKELLDYSGLKLGDGLYAFSQSGVEAAIAEHPLIQKVQLLRRPPHELRIFVVEYQAEAYVSLDKLYAVDKNAKVFARAEVLAGKNLPIITGISEKELQADLPSPHLVAGLKFISDWVKHGFSNQELAELHFDKDLGLSLELSGALQQVYLGRHGWEAKLRQLKRLRKALASQGRQPRVVRLGDGRDPRRVIVQMAARPSREQEAKNKVTKSG